MDPSRCISRNFGRKSNRKSADSGEQLQTSQVSVSWTFFLFRFTREMVDLFSTTYCHAIVILRSLTNKLAKASIYVQ